MGTFSIWHWLVVLVIVLLVFGTKKLRNIGGDLGGAVRGFREGMKEGATPPSDGSATPAQSLPPTAPPATGATIDVRAEEKPKP